MTGEQWISFLRQYGPIPTKDNLYDENLRRRAKRSGIPQILFEHPYEAKVLQRFDPYSAFDRSVVLTGTAGDGKTFLCGKIWETLGGDSAAWATQEPYLKLELSLRGGLVVVHVLRDLSAWVPVQGTEWAPEKLALMLNFCRCIFDAGANEFFIIAANDGQLTETIRRLPPDDNVVRAKEAIEELLVTDQESVADCQLALFNLSRGSSADLLDRALDAFMTHPGWQVCKNEASAADRLFGSECPIRHNYELLGDSLVRRRLRALLELCDQNGFHVPVRQILILLANSVLGHERCRDHLMKAEDVPQVVANGTRPLASFYSNVFGGNLPEARRGHSVIFEYLERFQIGRETSNRIDNILIFGESHDRLRQLFQELIASDRFYGEDPSYAAARQSYVEGVDEANEQAEKFLGQLVAQRRALFFKIQEKDAEELKLWELTVFRFGGEYLDDVLDRVRSGGTVRRGILGRTVRGMNRIFTGMMINSEHELYLASSANVSHSRVSRFLEERISVSAKHNGERVDIVYDGRAPQLRVCIGQGYTADLQLTLTRFEYLSRVAEGAMPNSFSKECFEDMVAFKSQLMRILQSRNDGHVRDGEVTFTILEVDGTGAAREKQIGVLL